MFRPLLSTHYLLSVADVEHLSSDQIHPGNIFLKISEQHDGFENSNCLPTF